MAFLFKHPNGVWYIGYYDANRKYRRKSTRVKTKGQARQALHQWEKQNTGQLEDITLRQFADIVDDSKTDHQRYALDHLLGYYEGRAVFCQDLDVDGFIRHLRGSVRPASVNSYCRSLRSLIKPYVGRYFSQNPFAGKVPNPGTRKPKILPPGKYTEYLRTVVRQPDRVYRELIRFYLYTGTRLSEAVGLRWTDVHLDKGYATILNSKTKEYEDIPLHQTVIRHLARLPRSGSRPFPYSANCVRQRNRKLIRGIGVPYGTIHILRHEFCTRLLKKGAAATAVQKLARHKRYETTELYVHATAMDFKDEINRL